MDVYRPSANFTDSISISSSMFLAAIGSIIILIHYFIKRADSLAQRYLYGACSRPATRLAGLLDARRIFVPFITAR